MRQTTLIKHKEVKKDWFLIDANGKRLGRLASKIATILRGKNKPTFTPNVDMGDCVVVINAKDVILTSDKEEKKIYYSHSGYPGGLKSITAKELRKRKPTMLLEKAIKGMLPHTKLGRKQFQNVYINAGDKHSQEAQKPKRIEV